MKPGSPRLCIYMSDWGIPECDHPALINEITDYIEKCPEEEIADGGMYDSIDTVIGDLFLELDGERKKGNKNLLDKDGCLYVEAGYFDSLAEQVSGYRSKEIRAELKDMGFLKTNEKRCTFQRHVSGKLIRYVAIYQERMEEVLKKTPAVEWERITGEASGKEAPGMDGKERGEAA